MLQNFLSGLFGGGSSSLPPDNLTITPVFNTGARFLGDGAGTGASASSPTAAGPLSLPPGMSVNTPTAVAGFPGGNPVPLLLGAVALGAVLTFALRR